MKAYTSSNYESTKALNPDATWSDTIWGGYVPQLSIHGIDEEVKNLILTAIRTAARKESDDLKASEMLKLCADISGTWKEAVDLATRKEAEAQQKLQEWNEVHRVEEGE